MKVYARVKSIGKSRNILEPVEYLIPDSVNSLRQLITAIVETEVEKYNAKGTGLQLIPYLTAEQIEEQADEGKVSFGTVYSDKKADKNKAVRNAMQCLEDGLVRVFMDEEELSEPDKELVIKEDTVFTFIRLTFLAGRMW